MLATNSDVDTTILALAGSNNIRWNVLREGSTSLNHRTHANTCLGILNDTTGEDDMVLNDAVARNLRTIAKDAAVAHLRIMRDVGTLHQHVLVTQNGLATSMRGTVDDDILTDDVAITNDTLRLLATELEVLWQSTDNSALMYLIFLTHARARADADKWEDDTAVAYLYIVFDIGEGEYLYVVADFSLWRHFGLWTYFACHNSQFSIFNSQLFISLLRQELYRGLPLPASC